MTRDPGTGFGSRWWALILGVDQAPIFAKNVTTLRGLGGTRSATGGVSRASRPSIL